MNTLGIILGCMAAGAILTAWGYVFYHRVIKNEKADFSPREDGKSTTTAHK